MRTEILDFLQTQNLGTVTVTTDVPWDDNGVPLYLKNLKRVYVSLEQIDSSPLIQALNGLNIQSEVTSVTVYFASDAKQLPLNYVDLVAAIKAAKDIDTIDGVNRREVSVSTDIEADTQVTEFEFRFTKLTS